MLSVGPGARHCSPSEDLPVGKSPHVGNIHYRQLPGYRLEVKTAGSGVSSRAELRSSALGGRRISHFLDGRQGDRPFGSAADARWERIRTNWRAPAGLAGAFGVREVEARYRRRARVFGIAAESIQEPRRRRGALQSIVRKPEVAKKGDSPWITPGKRRCDVLLLRRARSMKRGMIMIVGSTGFGRL